MAADIQNCGKCGLCLSVCPVYKSLTQEHASPRARLQLIKYYKNQSLPSSAGLKDIISKCLMCGNCSAICPSGINHYSQFMEMRTRMAETHGETPAVKSLVFLLAREYRLKMAAGIARIGQGIIPRVFIQKYRLGNIPLKQFPTFNPKPFRQAVPETILPRETPKGTVLYFTGCATNYLFDTIGFSTVNILRQMGYRVIIPRNQTCCGIPLLFHGAMDQARENIRTNLACLNLPDIQAIIVDCPTCGTALKNEYPLLQEKLGLDQAAVLDISSKVTDIISFILRNADAAQVLPAAAASDPVTVTYHQPCHLRNNLNGSGELEKWLGEAEGINYVRAVDMDSCCGGGGTFFYEYPEISGKMVREKIRHARDTNASVWLTECPVCRINLAGNLTETDRITLMHPVEIMNRLLYQQGVEVPEDR